MLRWLTALTKLQVGQTRKEVQRPTYVCGSLTSTEWTIGTVLTAQLRPKNQAGILSIVHDSQHVAQTISGKEFVAEASCFLVLMRFQRSCALRTWLLARRRLAFLLSGEGARPSRLRLPCQWLIVPTQSSRGDLIPEHTTGRLDVPECQLHRIHAPAREPPQRRVPPNPQAREPRNPLLPLSRMIVKRPYSGRFV